MDKRVRIPFLYAASLYDSKKSGTKELSVFASSTVAYLTCFDTWANSLFCPVIGRLDAIVMDKDKQRLPFFEKIGTKRTKILIGRLSISLAKFS